jgi:hypothetical protein
LALSAYPVESAGNDAWGRSTEFTKASIENYSKDGLSILIQQRQMLQVMKAEWNIQGLCFVDGNLKEKIYGELRIMSLVITGFQ